MLGRRAAGPGLEHAAARQQRNDRQHLGGRAEFHDREQVGQIVAQHVAGDGDGVQAFADAIERDLNRLDGRHDADVESRGVFVLQVFLDLGDQLRVVRALGVEPEHCRGVGQARAAHPKLDPILDRHVLDLTHTEDVAGLDRAGQQHRTVVGDDADRSARGNLERLVVGAVFLGLLRHQAHIRHRTHGLRVERAVRLAVFDGGLKQRGIATIGDCGDDVVQLAVGAPHFPGLPDHRRHRRIDDRIAWHVQVGDPPVGIDHGEAGARSVGGRDVGLNRRLVGVREPCDPRKEIAHAVVGIDANKLERDGVLLEHIGEENGNGMTEDDGIGDLHHGRFHVQREQNTLLLRGIHLLGEEGAQRLTAHGRRVDDFAGNKRRFRLQHRDRAIAADKLDTGVGRRRNGHRDLRTVEVAARHVRHMRLGVRAPGAHLVRIVAGVLLHGAGGAAVGIALPQHRVDGTTEHTAVARPDFLVRWRRIAVGIGRHVVTLALEFLDRGLELRDRGGDVGQLDDVRLRPHREFSEFGEFVVDPLRRLQFIREIGEDAAGQRNVLQLHRHAGGGDEGLDDRQQRVGRERRRFVGLCPNDFEI